MMHGLRCAAYGASFFAVGFALALPGATLGFLASTAGASEKAIGLIFVFRGTCYTVASLVGGRLGDATCVRRSRRGAHGLMFLALAAGAGGLALAKSATSPPLLGIALGAASVAMGALDTVGNVCLLRTSAAAHPAKSANLEMGVAHALFGVGCVAAPAVAAGIGSGAAAYDAGAALLAASGVLVLLVPGAAAPEDSPEPAGGDAATSPPPPPPSRTTKAAACFLFCLYVGAEQGVGALLAAASGLAEKRALATVSCFWAALVASRLTFAAVPDRSVDAGLSALLAVAAVAAAAVAAAHATGLHAWVAFAVVLGFCYGPVYPSAMARLDKTATVSSTFAGVLVAAGGLGEIALPPLFFKLRADRGTAAFLSALAAANAASLAAFLVVAANLRPKKRTAQFELISRNNSAWDDDADEELDWDGSYADFDTSTLGDAAGFV